MRYVGGKYKHGKALAEVIERYRTTQTAIYDPFVGGGAMAHVFSKRYSHVYASDTHTDLIMLYQALQTGWKPPTNVSEDEYQQLRQPSHQPYAGLLALIAHLVINGLAGMREIREAITMQNHHEVAYYP